MSVSYFIFLIFFANSSCKYIDGLIFNIRCMMLHHFLAKKIGINNLRGVFNNVQNCRHRKTEICFTFDTQLKYKKSPIKNKNPKHINIVGKAEMFNNLIKYQLQNLFCRITTEAFLYMTWQQSNRSEPNRTKRIQIEFN